MVADHVVRQPVQRGVETEDADNLSEHPDEKVADSAGESCTTVRPLRWGDKAGMSQRPSARVRLRSRVRVRVLSVRLLVGVARILRRY